MSHVPHFVLPSNVVVQAYAQKFEDLKKKFVKFRNTFENLKLEPEDLRRWMTQIVLDLHCANEEWGNWFKRGVSGDARLWLAQEKANWAFREAGDALLRHFSLRHAAAAGQASLEKEPT